MRKQLRDSGVIGCIVYVMLACIVYAAPPPSPSASTVLPGNADPARTIDNNQPPAPEPPPPAPAPVEGAAPAPENAPPPGADQVKFTLGGITLDGMTAYTPQTFEPVYAPFIGQEIALSKLYAFADAITERYHHDGYALSKAIIPPQKIGKDGAIHIQIIEGYIDKVEMQGKVRTSHITQAIADRITHYRPLNMNDLERDILLLNDLAGLNAQAVLKPVAADAGAPAGAVDLALVFGDTPFQSSVSTDNYNSRYVGPYEAGFQTGFNNVPLPYAQTTINGSISIPFNFLQFVQVAEKVALNSWGTTATLTYAYAHTQPGFTLEEEDIKSDSYNYSLLFAHPLLRSRAENFTLGGGLTLKDIHTDIVEEELYADKLTIANISGQYDLTDHLGGANIVQMKLNQGLHDFNSSANGEAYLSRGQGRSNFTDVTANVARLQTLTDKFHLYVAGEGQYSWSPLLSSEQFGFGGQQFGRAYDTSELTADNGIAGSAELRYSLPAFLPLTTTEVFTFYDIGRLWNYHLYESSATSAASTGLGFRLNEGDHFSGTFTMAQPLTKREDAPEYGNGQNPRYFGSLVYKF